MFNHVIQDCVLWTRGPKDMGIYVALFNMNLRGSILLLWEAKGASKLLEGKEKKKARARCCSLEPLRADVTQARCDSAPALQDYKQNLKQLI